MPDEPPGRNWPVCCIEQDFSHLAAACQCPTVAIFGASNVAEWRPWKAPHRSVLPGGIVIAGSGPVNGKTGAETKTQDVLVSDVVRGCEELLDATQD
ncbi:MAG: hypothetical protein E6L09_12785 [Verrucomicrobia bacterium]|nr:MAG: hypothetical protein E6L09_12785 [Verrucomicrobiota bacterium]